MKNGKVVIGIFVVIGLLLTGGFLWEHLDEKHQEELIQMAKDAEIGDGITLQQGVRAYFGHSGDWTVLGDDSVLLEAYSDEHALYARFEVNEKTEQLDILEFIYDFEPVSSNELDRIINAMVRAAKK